MQVELTKFGVGKLVSFVSLSVIETINPQLADRTLGVSHHSLPSYERIITNSHISQLIVGFIDFNEIVCDENYSLKSLPNWRWELIVVVEAQRQALIYACQRVAERVKSLIPHPDIFLGELQKITTSLKEEESPQLMVRREKFNSLEVNLYHHIYAQPMDEHQIALLFRQFTVINPQQHPISYVYYPMAQNIFRVILVGNALLVTQIPHDKYHKPTQILSPADREKGRRFVSKFIKNNPGNLQLVKNAISTLGSRSQSIALSILVNLLIEIKNYIEAYRTAMSIPDKTIKTTSIKEVLGKFTFIVKDCRHLPLVSERTELLDQLISESTELLVQLIHDSIEIKASHLAFFVFQALPEGTEKCNIILSVSNLLVEKREFKMASNLIESPSFPEEWYAKYFHVTLQVPEDGVCGTTIAEEWYNTPSRKSSLVNHLLTATGPLKDFNLLMDQTEIGEVFAGEPNSYKDDCFFNIDGSSDSTSFFDK